MTAPLYSGEWQLVKQTPYERVWLLAVDENNFVVKRETLLHSATAEANAETLKDTAGKRFGDGQVVARVPIDKYFSDIVPMRQAGDEAGIRRYLNDGNNRWLRTFGGRI